MSTLSAIATSGAVPTFTALPLSPLVFRLLAAKRRVSQTEARLAEKELAGPPSSSAELARLRTMHEDVRMAKDDLTAIEVALQDSSAGVKGARSWMDIAATDVGSVASALAALEAFVWSASGAAAHLQDAAMSLASKATGKPTPIADPVNTSRGLPASFIRPILSMALASHSHDQKHPIAQWHAWVDHQLRMVVAQFGPTRFSQWGAKLLSTLLGVSVQAAAGFANSADSSPSLPQIALIPGTIVTLLTQHLNANPDPSMATNKRKPLPTLTSCPKPFLPSYQSLVDLAATLRDYALADVSAALPLDRIPFSEPGILRLVDHATANATDQWIRTLARMQVPNDPAQCGLWPIEPPTGAGVGAARHGDDDGIAIKDAMWLPVAKARVAHDLLTCALVPL